MRQTSRHSSAYIFWFWCPTSSLVLTLISDTYPALTNPKEKSTTDEGPASTHARRSLTVTSCCCCFCYRRKPFDMNKHRDTQQFMNNFFSSLQSNLIRFKENVKNYFCDKCSQSQIMCYTLNYLTVLHSLTFVRLFFMFFIWLYACCVLVKKVVSLNKQKVSPTNSIYNQIHLNKFSWLN